MSDKLLLWQDLPAEHPVFIVTTLPTDCTDFPWLQLIENGIAACVSMIPNVVSRYRWDGKVVTDKEALSLIKTTAGKLEQLFNFIKAHHPYSVPEFAVFDAVAMNRDYLSWLLNEEVDVRITS